MNLGRIVFSHVLEFAPIHAFKYCVRRYNGGYRTKAMTSWKQFLCVSFAPLTHSLNDTVLCLQLHPDKLYYPGMGSFFNKSTLSRENERRIWRIYQDFALKLISQVRLLYSGYNEFAVKSRAEYAHQASWLIDFCLSVILWARFRTPKAVVKHHIILDQKESTSDLFITDSPVHDVNVLDNFSLSRGSCLVDGQSPYRLCLSL